MPNFQKFDGCKGNTREHITSFINSMDPFTLDVELCLLEFSKSLVDRAYTWYLNLKPVSIQNWEHLDFNARFICAEAKFSLVELSRTREFAGEDLDLYMKGFHEKALDCCNTVDEETMVGVFLHGMANDYPAFLENFSFPSFSKLMEASE